MRLLRIIWNALALVAIALLIYFFWTQVANAPDETGSGTIATVRGRSVVIEAIQQVNKQTFAEYYEAVDVQYTEVPENWLKVFGLKQEILVLVRGRIPAGFDLQGVDDDRLWISADGRRVQLTLPPPTIFEDNVAVDFENSRILAASDTCPSFVCPQGTLEAYQRVVLPNAQVLLIDAAREHGILERAARDGQTYYRQLLRSLGFDEVRVIVDGYIYEN
jgi:hypothetical protein